MADTTGTQETSAQDRQPYQYPTIFENPLAHIPKDSYKFGEKIYHRSKEIQVAQAYLDYLENPIVIESWYEDLEGSTTSTRTEIIPPQKPEDLIAGMPAIPLEYGDPRIKTFGQVRVVQINPAGEQREIAHPIEIFLNDPRDDGVFELNTRDFMLRVRVLGYKNDLPEEIRGRFEGVFAEEIHEYYEIIEKIKARDSQQQ